MKRHPLARTVAGVTIAALVAIGLTGASLFTGYTPLSAQAPAAADKWEAAIKKFEDQDKVAAPPQNAIVFVGASSIVRWDLPQYFPQLGANAINRGFGGSLIGDSVRYAERVVIPYKPRLVVLYAGDNDVETSATADQIADEFTRFDKKVHAALPNTRIIFISIKPSIRRFKWMDKIVAANAKVKAYCEGHPNLSYVDIVPQMLLSDGKPDPSLLVADGLHMTPAGYKIWTAALTPLLK